ncbi:MAG: hypothetical protein L0Y72_30380 [Gemmataceae bacterium]|nr:hypothetical protein [Gemmataceae bacterium]MCI0743355.1 hypothetical protein [Gemmataceae bacterium]
MTRLLVASFIALGLAVGQASALELKNIRPCYGPLGATRTDVKCMPGDVLFMTYDIEGLALDRKTGRANYVTTLELLDKTQKSTFKKDTPNDVAPHLGGTRMPGDLHVILPRNQAPGKYFIKLTVQDRLGKESKSFLYEFEVVASTFGFIGVSAQAVGFPGQHYSAHFAIVDMSLDSKKSPNVDVMMRVLDNKQKPVAMPIFSNLPKDLPEEIDLKKENFVPMQYPIYLNRAGSFFIEIMARDKIANKTIELRYPLTVIDLAGIGK